jgi:2'-5' RNA ligase
MSASDRLFIAFETPEDVKRKALELIAELQKADADVSWEKEDKLHCTLKFLGNVDHQRGWKVAEELLAMGKTVPPFSVRYSRPGYFGDSHAPSVIWLGINDVGEALGALVKKIGEAMDPLRFAREKRVFHPHVTLGRVKSPKNAEKLIATLETLTFSSEVYPIESMKLMKSDLKPAGSVYSVYQSIPLIGKNQV